MKLYVLNKIYTEKTISDSFQMEWDMIVVTVFLSILNQMELHLVQKIERKTVQCEKNCKYSFLSVVMRFVEVSCVREEKSY